MVVYELLRMRAPHVLILLTLLVTWNTQIPHTIDPLFESCDFFLFLYSVNEINQPVFLV